MADPGPFKLKTVLTKASWDKHKGVVAKIFKSETGIGKLIDMATASHKQVNWDRFRSDKTPKKDFEIEYKTNVAELIKDLEDLETKAQKVAGDFKKNPLISKSSVQAVVDIQVEAGNLAQALGLHYTTLLTKLK